GLLRSELAEQSRLRVGRRLDDGVLVVVQAAPGRIDAIREGVRDLMWLLTIMMLLFGVATIGYLSRALVEPIRKLTDVATALARGDLHARIRGDLSDEIGEIGRAIDGMADELDARHRSLRTEEARLGTVLDSMG